MPRVMLMAVLVAAVGQAETFGAASFTPPPGWKREATGSVVGFTHATSSRWTRLAVYQPVPARPGRDLAADWDELVRKGLGGGPLKPGGTQRGAGYTLWSGGGTFPFGGKEHLALLFSFVLDDGRDVAVLMTGSDQEDLPAVTAALESLRFESAGPAAQAPRPAAAAAPARPTVASRYQFTTTTFSDGWVATEQPDGVALTRGPLRAFLHFAVPYTDATRTLDDERRVLHFWNLLLSPHLRVPTVTVRPSEAGIGALYFGEGDGVDAAGRPVHAALLVHSENGAAFAAEVVAPDVATFRAAFPTLEGIRALWNMNKFDVALADLPGKWTGGGSAYNQYVYTATGLSAGLVGVSFSESFVFGADGRFDYSFVGVSGQMGAQTAASQKRSGRTSVGSWTVTLADTTGRTDTYHAQFELVRGGRVLHLVHQKYSGQAYHLVRADR